MSDKKVMPIFNQYYHKSDYKRNALIVERNALIVGGFYDTISLPAKKNLKGHEYRFYTDVAGKDYDETNMYMANQLLVGFELHFNRIWVIILGEPQIYDLVQISEGYFSLTHLDKEVIAGVFLFNMYPAVLCGSCPDLALEREPWYYGMYAPMSFKPYIIPSSSPFKATLSFSETIELSQEVRCRCWLHGKVLVK